MRTHIAAYTFALTFLFLVSHTETVSNRHWQNIQFPAQWLLSYIKFRTTKGFQKVIIIQLFQQNSCVISVFKQLSHTKNARTLEISCHSSATVHEGSKNKVKRREIWKREEKLIERSCFNSHILLCGIWSVAVESCSFSNCSQRCGGPSVAFYCHFRFVC